MFEFALISTSSVDFALYFAGMNCSDSHATNRFDATLRSRLEANMEAMAGAASLAEVSWLDIEFHTIIMEASGRRRFIATWRSIHAQLLWLSALHQTLAESGRVREITVAAHRRLVKTMMNGDAARARALAVEQLTDWRPGITRMQAAKTRR